MSFDRHPHSPELPAVPFIALDRQHAPIAREMREVVQRVFDDNAYILGEDVALLETEIAEFCDSREAIACHSGSDALMLSLTALDVGPGDEVITSPFTFFATAGAIHRVGARPVFVDIDPATFNLDIARVEAAITARTKAVVPVHLFGQCVEMESLWRLAVQFGIPIVEDACQAIGATYRGRRAGVLGTLGCFSFFPTKNLGGVGDGGIVTTDDRFLAQRLRRLRNHGDVGGYEHVEVGTNSRLDTLQAAAIRVKLAHLEDWNARRRANAARYATLFEQAGATGVVTPVTTPECIHVFNQYVVRVEADQRDRVIAELRDERIGCAVYYPKPLHRQPCFEGLGYTEGSFPEAERAAREVIALPIHPDVTNWEQERVVDGLLRALVNGAGHTGRRAA